MLKDSTIVSGFEPPTSVDYGEPISLYPYQEIAVEQAKKGLYGILQSKAGSGKTQMGIALIKEFGRRTLWLTHTKDLLSQSKERAERYIDKDLLGTITEGKVNIGKGVTFATVQTMCKLDLSQYKHYWDVIIVDECHRCVSTPTQMSMFGKVLGSLSARHKYGLSATVHRADGMIQATYALLGEIVYTVPDEAVADKVMQVGIKAVATGVKISRECLNTDGTLNYAKLINYLCECSTRNVLIRDSIVNESDKSCLVLSDRLAHLEALLNLLPPNLKDKAVMISGKMTTKKGKAEREQAIEDMRTGKKQFLFATYNLCKEGLDIPRLERLFLTTNQKDYAVITQSIGRVARTFEGKADPIVYDFVDDIGYMVKSYKTRCATYRKNDCYFMEGADDYSK
jgi:superfamily II DNA or RNA helicase